ncbi:hypothetical protein DN069_28010 [Streptacidiphilus pinicola]|uniref:Uncharacterized protein n=1 Tax=Streptacidiphilus pinicola TaxID=2219663 RepID=A0A2X0IBP5_9ACTN|nr:hypothetical protein DN069_28010 [Streptacidiphilus pinicola]
MSLGLLALIVMRDLNTASLAASVVGAIAGIAGAAFAAIALLRNPDAGSAAGTRRVWAGEGGIAAGGDITGNAFGTNSTVKVSGSRRRGAAQPDQSHRDVKAGRDGIVAGGDITGNAIGEGGRIE